MCEKIEFLHAYIIVTLLYSSSNMLLDNCDASVLKTEFVYNVSWETLFNLQVFRPHYIISLNGFDGNNTCRGPCVSTSKFHQNLYDDDLKSVTFSQTDDQRRLVNSRSLELSFDLSEPIWMVYIKFKCFMHNSHTTMQNWIDINIKQVIFIIKENIRPSVCQWKIIAFFKTQRIIISFLPFKMEKCYSFMLYFNIKFQLSIIISEMKFPYKLQKCQPQITLQNHQPKIILQKFLFIYYRFLNTIHSLKFQIICMTLNWHKKNKIEVKASICTTHIDIPF